MGVCAVSGSFSRLIGEVEAGFEQILRGFLVPNIVVFSGSGRELSGLEVAEDVHSRRGRSRPGVLVVVAIVCCRVECRRGDPDWQTFLLLPSCFLFTVR